MMFPFYINAPTKDAIPIVAMTESAFPEWLARQEATVKNWVVSMNFNAKPETICCIATNDGSGQLGQVLLGVEDKADFWPWGALPFLLPKGIYQFAPDTEGVDLTSACMAWGFGAYEFTCYKKSTRTSAKLVIPKQVDQARLQSLVKATYLVRDLINTPSEDMGPFELMQTTRTFLEPFGAVVTEIVGDALLAENYPAIHRVGRASTRPPRLIDVCWGNPAHPAVTLIGKGVCFDSGGLDLKTSQGMALMKKDMAGAAHVLGLASLIMSNALPIYLRVLIPAVDNVISGNAYRPGDIIVTRKGLSVEVTNTDAEGRLIVADALAEASSKTPALIFDFTTLTGAARVALGPDITALFSNDPALAKGLLLHAKKTHDAMVELPLYKPYRKYLDSLIADMNNAVSIPYGGAITAGLFLNEFVPSNLPWAHFDLMAWNLGTLAGRSEGGEAMAIRAACSYLVERFGN